MLRTTNLVQTARATLFVFCAPMLMAGCSRGGQAPSENYRAGERAVPTTTQQRPGLTGKQKMAILVGAAALYYVYKTQKDRNAEAKAAQAQTNAPPGVQLYRSRATGGIYWREPNNPQRVHWLTVPPQGIQVPQSDYNRVMGERNQWSSIPVHTQDEPPPSSGQM